MSMPQGRAVQAPDQKTAAELRLLTDGVRGDFKGIAIADVLGGGSLMPQNFGEVIAFAEVMARSAHAIPKHLRGNPGACMAVTMQALRWGMDPFAVASKSFSVNDQVAYEAQLIAAVVNTRAPIRRTPDYAFEDGGTELRCIVRVEMLDGSMKEYISPRIKEIPTKNSPLWKSDPQQQLGYYSIRAWARRYTPEVILGVYGRDELDMRDVTPSGSSLRDRLRAPPAPAAEMAARVEVLSPATTGEASTDIDSAPAHDPETGEIDDAEVPAEDVPSEPEVPTEDDAARAERFGEADARDGMTRNEIPDEFKVRPSLREAWLRGWDKGKNNG